MTILTRRHIGLALGSAFAAALTAGALAATRAEAAVTIGSPAPAFTAVDSRGVRHNLADFRGRTVVLEWTNHQCPFVVKHYDTGNMQATQRRAAADGAVWLTIVSSAPGKQGHVSAAQANDLTRTRNAAPTAVLLDESGAVGKLYGARTTPQMVVINAAGNVVYSGAMSSNPSSKKEDVATSTNYVAEALTAVRAGRAPAVAATRPYGCSVKYAS